MRLSNFLTVFTLAIGFATTAIAADYAREKNWAEEVAPSVMVGDTVWLEIPSGHKFLTLFTEADAAKAKAGVGVIVIHGMGVHPDWGLIGPLRQNLPEHGYATLSIQMPVLKADAKGESYPPTFDEAAERIKTAIDFMRAKGYQKIVLATHKDRPGCLGRHRRTGSAGLQQAEIPGAGFIRRERFAAGADFCQDTRQRLAGECRIKPDDGAESRPFLQWQRCAVA